MLRISVLCSAVCLFYHVVSATCAVLTSFQGCNGIEVKVAMLSFINAMIPRSFDEEQRLFTRVESKITDNQIAGTK